MKKVITSLFIGLTLTASSFSALSASQTEDYPIYSFHYTFTQKLDLALTHYLQLKQEMAYHLSDDIDQQTAGFFRHYEQSADSLTASAEKVLTKSIEETDPQTLIR
ncbi:hypothetical protein [Lacimicrobium sp. SS2-24]|uniref:hypothetical protein n=1 Tax=Lacimicrobium sp. SS2-24 TaxID=2005569 RepID=UPI000B4C1390|nr:hypothetical protein [Lacimicrobium sp. SS2-24]